MQNQPVENYRFTLLMKAIIIHSANKWSGAPPGDRRKNPRVRYSSRPGVASGAGRSQARSLNGLGRGDHGVRDVRKDSHEWAF